LFLELLKQMPFLALLFIYDDFCDGSQELGQFATQIHILNEKVDIF
jgi:hypothetical protein